MLPVLAALKRGIVPCSPQVTAAWNSPLEQPPELGAHSLSAIESAAERKALVTKTVH